MLGENNLYEYLYQTMRAHIMSGDIRAGQQLPSQQELCRRYHVGITTVRRVIRMLEEDGFISSAPRKRATVLYDTQGRACLKSLLQRKNSILDVYQGLVWIMPALYLGGAMRCQSFDRLYACIASIRDDMDQRNLYAQSSLFFLELLSPYHNQALYNLQTSSEHFTNVPYLPASGLPNHYFVTPQQVQEGLLELLWLIRHRAFPQVWLLLEQLNTRAWARNRRYLDALEARFPSLAGAPVPQQQFLSNTRAHRYTMVARHLFRRIKAGEFQGRKYIPSLPELQREYNISQATALSAVALLNDIGAVSTLDKRGTVVAQPGCAPTPLRLDRAVIGENIIRFLSALQILAMISGRLAEHILCALDKPSVRAFTALEQQTDSPTSALYVRALLELFKTHAPYNSLSSLFVWLDDMLIWGYYLQLSWSEGRPGIEQEATACYHALVRALARRDAAAVSEHTAALFRLAYTFSRSQVIALGADPATLPAELI